MCVIVCRRKGSSARRRKRRARAHLVEATLEDEQLLVVQPRDQLILQLVHRHLFSARCGQFSRQHFGSRHSRGVRRRRRRHVVACRLDKGNDGVDRPGRRWRGFEDGHGWDCCWSGLLDVVDENRAVRAAIERRLERCGWGHPGRLESRLAVRSRRERLRKMHRLRVRSRNKPQGLNLRWGPARSAQPSLPPGVDRD